MQLTEQHTRPNSHRRYCRTGPWLAILALLVPGKAGWPEGAAASTNPLRVPIEAESTDTKYALVVGVDDYDKEGSLPPLRCACNDARGFRDFLQGRWQFTKILYLAAPRAQTSEPAADRSTPLPPVGPMPTVGHVRGSLNKLCEQARGNTVVFFFAGHGLREKQGDDYVDYLMPKDGYHSLPSGTGSAIHGILSQLQQQHPRRAILFFDACRNIADLTRGVVVRAGISPPKEPPSAPGFAWMYACDAGETSQEDTKTGHGVFTEYLLKGLKGGDLQVINPDGSITFRSLRAYVIGKVESDLGTHFSTHSQHPVGMSSDDDMVLMMMTKPQPRVDQNKLNAHIKAARRYLDQKNFPKAAEEAKQITILDSNNKDGHYLLGSAAYEQGDGKFSFDELRKYVRMADASDPDYSDALRKLLNLLQKRQKPRSGRSSLSDLWPNRVRTGTRPRVAWQPNLVGQGGFRVRPWTLRQMQAADAIGSAVGARYTRLAVALQAAHYLVSTGRAHEIVSRSAPPQEPLNPDGEAEAELSALQAVAANPNNVRAHYDLGGIYLGQRRADDAIREFQEALRVNPELMAAKTGEQSALQSKPPAAAWRLASEALQLTQVERYAEAEAKAREAIARDDNSPAAHFALGRVYHSRQRYNDAMAEYEKARSQDPTLVDADMALEAAKKARSDQQILVKAQEAYRLIQDSKVAEARIQLNAVLEHNLDSGLVHLVSGRLAELDGSSARAIREYQEALRLQPELTEARDALQRIVMHLPPVDVRSLVEALRTLVAQNRFEDAEPQARELLARAPDNPEAHLFMGHIYFHQQRFDDAIVEYLEALQLDVHQPAAEQALERARAAKALQDTDRLVTEAYRHLSRREFLEVRDKARKAIELQVNDPAAHALLGNALLWLGEIAAGQQEVARAEALQRDAVPARELALVQIGKGTGDWLKAMSLYSEAAQKRDLAQQKWNRRRAKDLLKEAARLDREAVTPLQEAEQEFRKALPVQPDLSDVRERLTALIAHNNLGAVLHLQGRIDEDGKSRNAYESALRHFNAAEEQYQKAVDLDPYHIAYFNLGNNFLAKGQVFDAVHAKNEAKDMWQKAVENLTTAVQLYGDNAGTQALLSAAYLRQNNIPEATKWARRARDRGLTDHFIFADLKKKGGSL